MLDLWGVVLSVILLVIVALLCLALNRLAAMRRELSALEARADASARERDAHAAELARQRQDLSQLVQTTATDQALERHRFESLVQRFGEATEHNDELRHEVTRQLEQDRAALDRRLDAMTDRLETRLTEVRSTVDAQLADIRQDTNVQLDRMRETVDEKLQQTLNDRITQSFALVNESLDKVGRGLGEMQSLASDVGGLKRVLSGVKTRGMLGEVQLGAILQEVLAPTQYDTDVATVPGSANRVEFAVKLPGAQGETVYLPIDAKFPGDAYEHLRDALDAGDTRGAEEAWKTLEARLKQEAKDIHEKYVAPPATTSYGILFLPFEGLYAEVVDRPGLLAELQRSYRVNVAGPSTMAAMLNSLQMGFQTVAIQRRASEIQTVLAAVKTEFGTYQSMLRRAQKQLGTVSRTMDTLVGTRTRAMERKLMSITELGDLAEAERTLGIDAFDSLEVEAEVSTGNDAATEDAGAGDDLPDAESAVEPLARDAASREPAGSPNAASAIPRDTSASIEE